MAITLQKVKLFWPPWTSTVRHKSKVNIQKPRIPHFDRLRVLETTKPVFVVPDSTPPAWQCQRWQIADKNDDHPQLTLFERLLGDQLLDLLGKHAMVAFYHANSVSLRSEFELKKLLRKNGAVMKVYNRFIVKNTLPGTKFEALSPLFKSHTKILFWKEPNVGVLLQLQKKMPEYILLSAVIENRILSKEDLEWYGRLPGLEVLRAQLSATLNTSQMQTQHNLNYFQRQLLQSLTTYAQQSAEATQKL